MIKIPHITCTNVMGESACFCRWENYFLSKMRFLLQVFQGQDGMIIVKCYLIEEIYAMPETQPAFP
jgi:hypothetical protein